MKNSNNKAPQQSQTPKHNTQFNTNKHRPENKDDLDSREGEEQISKGDDITHNQKAQKNKKSGEKTNESDKE